MLCLCLGMVHSHRHRGGWCYGQNRLSFPSSHCLHLPWGKSTCAFNTLLVLSILLKLLGHFLTISHPVILSLSSSVSSTLSSLPLSPQVFVLSGVIAMVTCAVFLRLNSLLKLAVLLLAVAVYSYLIHLAFLTLTRHDMTQRSVGNITRTSQAELGF